MAVSNASVDLATMLIGLILLLIECLPEIDDFFNDIDESIDSSEGSEKTFSIHKRIFRIHKKIIHKIGVGAAYIICGSVLGWVGITGLLAGIISQKLVWLGEKKKYKNTHWYFKFASMISSMCLFSINFLSYVTVNYNQLECQPSDLWMITALCVLIWSIVATVGTITANIQWRGERAIICWLMSMLSVVIITIVIWSMLQTKEISRNMHDFIKYTTIVIATTRIVLLGIIGKKKWIEPLVKSSAFKANVLGIDLAIGLVLWWCPYMQ